jgi:hypothetical protein
MASPKGWRQDSLASLDHLGYSIIVGHTHRQSVVQKTGHDIDGNIFTLAGVEAGCMCVVKRTEKDGRFWPNYGVSPRLAAGICNCYDLARWQVPNRSCYICQQHPPIQGPKVRVVFQLIPNYTVRFAPNRGDDLIVSLQVPESEMASLMKIFIISQINEFSAVREDDYFPTVEEERVNDG